MNIIEKLCDLSRAVNWSYNINDTRTFLDSTVKLFQTVHGENGHFLTELPIRDCQPVGLAFARMALYGNYNGGDRDINSVAAENAYYCLAKSFLVSKSVYTLPAIFRLFNDDKDLLADKLITSWISMCEHELGMPIRMALGGNPYTDPRLNDFRNQALDFSYNIRYYVLCNFYIPSSKQFCIPNDLFLLQPDSDEIERFLAEKSNSDVMEMIMTGEEHFESVFQECEKALI